MAFRIEALPAKYGDCLFLTFGDGTDRPSRILVDGGPPGVFNATLKPRLRQEQRNDGVSFHWISNPTREAFA